MPKPHVTVSDDGSITLEWTGKDTRASIYLDAKPSDSGWYVVSKIESGGPNGYGALDTFDPAAFVEIVRRYIAPPPAAPNECPTCGYAPHCMCDQQ